MEKEKYTSSSCESIVEIEEGKIKAFNKRNTSETSFRIHKDGFLGVHYQKGKMSDEEGFKIAEENLSLKREYPYEMEAGIERSRDKSEEIISDSKLMELAKKGISHLNKKYQNFIFAGSFEQTSSEIGYENSKGAKYSNKDSHVGAYISFKHKDSKDINDGSFVTNMRTFSLRKFYKMADNYLENFEKTLELPEELIIQMRYYDFTSFLRNHLDAEDIKLGTSLFSGKIGEKIFSDNFTLFHCCDDKNAWHDCFWDGEGVVLKGDKLTYIKNGVLLRGFANKRIAKKYKVRPTGSANFDWTDIPKNGRISLNIKRSKLKTKELLNGRLSIIPLQYSGGGFNEKGDYKMPVQIGLLCDGEKILGKVPPFTMSVNLFDMFGKNFIGVGKDNPAVFNDKCILVKMNAEKL